MHPKKAKARENQAQFEGLLATPTNNFGLAHLFKNFILIDTDS